MSSRHLIVPISLFILLLLAAFLRGPKLFSVEGIAGAIIVSAPLILATLALTPIALVGRGGVDLAVGPLISFINVTLIVWLVKKGITAPTGVFLYVVAVGVAYQLVQGLIIVYVRVAPIIVSLSGFLALSGLNLVILPRPSGVAPEWMSSWGAGTSIISPVFIILLISFVGWYVFFRTAFFTHLRLTGFDEKTAYTSGVHTDIVRLGAHIIGGIYGGLAALTYTALISSGDPTQGGTYTLTAVTALVLGGTSLVGGRGGGLESVLGAINLYLISYVLATFSFGKVSGFVTQLAYGVILIISLLINIAFTGVKSKTSRMEG
jgi:ribose transport system permease protein